jgi:hypothetical protein
MEGLVQDMAICYSGAGDSVDSALKRNTSN